MVDRNSTDKLDEIIRLKREKNAVILAHYYTVDEVQAAADFVGDSLALSQQAAATDAKIILFAGVRFMAETAKILSPDKKVLIPDLLAGCSLADSCRAEDLAAMKRRYPDHRVVAYVNTSVEVKALTDICCTSSNAVRIVSALPAGERIIFAPDRNLGDYVRRKTGRDMVLWDGACHVHESFSPERIQLVRGQYPGAKVVAHPECPASVLAEADFVGSTAEILSFCERDASKEFIVVTEPGILYELRRRCPEKSFLTIPANMSGGCNFCEYMKMVSLDKMIECLRNETPVVEIDEDIRKKAEGSIRAMLDLS